MEKNKKAFASIVFVGIKRELIHLSIRTLSSTHYALGPGVSKMAEQ